MAKDESIVIKKIIKGGHGHHGGAWKVAYADFVTAMMAFFLLLWLLNSVSADKLSGIGNYFAPTVGIKDGMGIGIQGGQGDVEIGRSQKNFSKQGIIFGAPATGPIIDVPKDVNEDMQDPQSEAIEQKNIELVRKALEQKMLQEKSLQQYQENLMIDQTPEGLRIQLIDKEKKPMFMKGSSEHSAHAQIILNKVAEIIRYVPNYLSVSGHTTTEGGGGDGKQNWELSASRANATRNYLIGAGVEGESFARLVAWADRDPLNKEEPDAPENMRISITLLKHSVVPYHRQASAEEIFKQKEDKQPYFLDIDKDKKLRMAGGAETKISDTGINKAGYNEHTDMKIRK